MNSGVLYLSHEGRQAGRQGKHTDVVTMLIDAFMQLSLRMRHKIGSKCVHLVEFDLAISVLDRAL
jgi:hypothetical protein